MKQFKFNGTWKTKAKAEHLHIMPRARFRALLRSLRNSGKKVLRAVPFSHKGGWAPQQAQWAFVETDKKSHTV